jgi:uncharacterized protein YaeQ
MALTPTLYNVEIELANVDDGVYETLAVRIALHPSETPEFLYLRLLAYCLEYTAGIAFSKGGISDGDQPALMVTTPDGRILSWIEVGLPDAERLNKAAKGAERVAVYTHHNPAQLRRLAEGRRIHRAGEIEIFAFDRRFLGELAALLERRMRLEVSVTGGHLYINLGGKSVAGEVTEHRLTD